MFRAALLVLPYLLAALPANAGELTASELAAIREARTGEMRKLALLVEPAAALSAPFVGEDGAERTLAPEAGRIVVLNFWATWCAPCREEMPSLNALQKTLGGDRLRVVTVATGRNSPAAMKAFFAEHGIDALPLHADPRTALAREAGVLGLPVTLILDPAGREIGRLTGGADWNGEAARDILSRLVEAAAS